MNKWLAFLSMIIVLLLFGYSAATAHAGGFADPIGTGGGNATYGLRGVQIEPCSRGTDYLEPPRPYVPFWGGGHRRNPAKKADGEQSQRPNRQEHRLVLEEQAKEEEEEDPPDPMPELIAEQPDLVEWVDRELASVNLGDARLDLRLRKMVAQFSMQPNASIPQASGTWKDTKAAYRFFDNRKTTHGKIINGHRQSTMERMESEQMVLVLQDTTSLNYTSHPHTQRLGPLENEHCKGLFVHTAMAVSTDGVPLGLLDQEVWARDPETTGKRHQRKKRPIEEKESFKWIQGLRQSIKDVSAPKCLVTVADRESDVFELFSEAQKNQTHILIRASWNRSLKGSSYLLWDHVGRLPFAGSFSVQVGRAKNRLPRLATLNARFTSVTIQAPSGQRSRLKPVELNAIEVVEDHAPAKEEPLRWLLLTTLPVQSIDDAIKCVRWYALRWLIERYHYVLKSGCLIEKRELETAERIENCLGVYAIVAWRLLWMTYYHRIHPDEPCTIILKTHEWQALYCYIHKTSSPPAQPPSLHQAMWWIAQLGGFLARKGDGQPGVKVLWRGWQRLQDIAQTWLIARSPPPLMGNA